MRSKGPLGAILGHFGPFWSDFGAQSKRLGPVWSLFLIHLASQNDLNSPKSGTVGQGNYHTGLVGAFRGHFGPFWTILGSILEWFLGPEQEAGACFETFSHAFGCSEWLEWPQIWYSGTRELPDLTDGAILGAISEWFYCLEQETGACMEPVWSLFLTWLAAQNDLNGSKSGKVGRGMTRPYCWGPLGAILEWFWNCFRVILEWL